MAVPALSENNAYGRINWKWTCFISANKSLKLITSNNSFKACPFSILLPFLFKWKWKASLFLKGFSEKMERLPTSTLGAADYRLKKAHDAVFAWREFFNFLFHSLGAEVGTRLLRLPLKHYIQLTHTLNQNSSKIILLFYYPSVILLYC